ncbi:TPA: hypothetical protein PNO69_004518 [Salmonella enterica]|nr:hypothetical protein [Salmonella enterica]HCH9607961.1 hypothetical protein [Salmonella enterica]HDI5000255.1 hypothetical protein [Salmonella enterica]HDI5005076.1 hypothetical protein [Salmonella enterica]
MLTMLYDAETLKPQLLISEDIESEDIGKKFWAINYSWEGTFNAGSIKIHHEFFEDYTPDITLKCYKFTSEPSKEYYDMYAEYYYKGSHNQIAYEPWFLHFEDLVEKGEINK